MSCDLPLVYLEPLQNEPFGWLVSEVLALRERPSAPPVQFMLKGAAVHDGYAC